MHVCTDKTSAYIRIQKRFWGVFLLLLPLQWPQSTSWLFCRFWKGGWHCEKNKKKVWWGVGGGGGGESEHISTPKGKSPLLEAARRMEPTRLHYAGQPAQHTTDWAIVAPWSLPTGLLCTLPCRYRSHGVQLGRGQRETHCPAGTGHMEVQLGRGQRETHCPAGTGHMEVSCGGDREKHTALQVLVTWRSAGQGTERNTLPCRYRSHGGQLGRGQRETHCPAGTGHMEVSWAGDREKHNWGLLDNKQSYSLCQWYNWGLLDNTQEYSFCQYWTMITTEDC